MRLRLPTLLLFALFLAPSAFADITRGHLVPGAWENSDVVDLNGDGLTDLLQGDHVLLNTGGGNFAFHSLGLEHGDYAVDTLDVNGDGRLDLLATVDQPTAPGGTPASRRYFLYIATGSLTYAAKVRVSLAAYTRPYIADVDDDGRDDLVQLEGISDERSLPVASEWKVMISRGDGTFAARTPFRLPPNPQFGLYNFNHRLPASDLDGDGRTDLVVRFANELAVLRGTGGGDFAAPKTRFLPRHFGNTSAIEDINRDGHPDLVFGGRRAVHVFLNDGSGNFPRATSLHLRKIRNVSIPDWLTPGVAGYSTEFNNPVRKFGIGEFVKRGRTEIITATGEGDVIVMALEDGKLREVARLQTEYLEAATSVGAFRNPGTSDVLLTWHLNYPEARPRPRLLYGEPALAESVARPSGRNRAVRSPWAPAVTAIDVQVGGLCIAPHTESWSFEREGYFAAQRRDASASSDAPVVEAMFSGDAIHLRYTPSWAKNAVDVMLTLNRDGEYEGVAPSVSTFTCGTTRVKFTATKR